MFALDLVTPIFAIHIKERIRSTSYSYEINNKYLHGGAQAVLLFHSLS